MESQCLTADSINQVKKETNNHKETSHNRTRYLSLHPTQHDIEIVQPTRNLDFCAPQINTPQQTYTLARYFERSYHISARNHPRDECRLIFIEGQYALRHIPTQTGSVAIEQILVTGEGTRVSILPECRIAVEAVSNNNLKPSRNRVNYLQPAGRGPKELAQEASQSGLLEANPALLPVHCVHQLVVA